MEDCSTLFRKEVAFQGSILLEGEDRNFRQRRQECTEDRKCVAWQDENKCDPSLSAVDYHDFIEKKIDDIRKETDSASVPAYTVHGTSNLNKFKTVDVDLVTKIIGESPTKHFNVDPIPTWLVKDCVSLLAPYIKCVVNHSVVEGCFPSKLKYATISLLIKKSGLNDAIPSSYRPVSTYRSCLKYLNVLSTGR